VLCRKQKPEIEVARVREPFDGPPIDLDIGNVLDRSPSEHSI